MIKTFYLFEPGFFSPFVSILLTKATVALRYHRVLRLYFLAVVFVATIIFEQYFKLHVSPEVKTSVVETLFAGRLAHSYTTS